MWKFTRILAVATSLILSSPLIYTVHAQEGTPTGQVLTLQPTPSLPWYVGALIFIGIAVGVTVLKGRIAAAQNRTIVVSSCCAPLVDDDTRQFRFDSKQPEKKK